MENADLSTVVRNGAVEDLRIVCIHGWVSRVCHILADEFDFGSEDELAFVK